MDKRLDGSDSQPGKGKVQIPLLLEITSQLSNLSPVTLLTVVLTHMNMFMTQHFHPLKWVFQMMMQVEVGMMKSVQGNSAECYTYGGP
jgi:hypothetical protein